jgi:hypothetical protein
MELTNTTGFVAGWSVGLQPSGREVLVVVAKATFGIPRSGEEAVLAEEQQPLVDADVFAGRPGLSAPAYESDYAPRKRRCDVLLNGSAHAPGGRPATQVPVGLLVGSLRKGFHVMGARHWVKSLLSFTASRPQPFVRQEISYGVAFGGRDVSHPDPAKHRWYELNHAGIGFHSNRAEAEGKPLPRTEEVGKPVERLGGKYRPMAFGSVGRAWQPRAGYAGTYDKRWLEEHSPFPAPDLDERYYQAAPADQQTDYLRGGEQVVFLNLTPKGRSGFQLPPLELPVVFHPRDGEKERVLAAADTLVLEPDLGRFTVTWRASRPLKRNAFELREVVVGKPSRAWERARDLGKVYYRSLAELKRPRRERE